MNIFGWVIVICCAGVGFVFGKIQIGLQGSKPATFERFDGTCPGHNTPMIYELQGVRVEGMKMWLNTTFTVKEDISGVPTMSLSITRCKSKENPDTCEQFHKFKTNNYCSLLNSGSDQWNPFYGTFTPPFKCPFKKGIYRGIDSAIDMKAFLLFTGGDWFWKLNTDIRERRSNRLLACVLVEALITSGPMVPARG